MVSGRPQIQTETLKVFFPTLLHSVSMLRTHLILSINQFNFHFGSYFFVESHNGDGNTPTNDELYQLDWQGAFCDLKVSLYENRAPLQYAGRGSSTFGLRSFLNLNPRDSGQEGFCSNHKNPWEKQGSVIWSRLARWATGRQRGARASVQTRQHLFSELLCPFSVLHVVRPLKPIKKMKRLRLLCLGL